MLNAYAYSILINTEANGVARDNMYVISMGLVATAELIDLTLN